MLVKDLGETVQAQGAINSSPERQADAVISARSVELEDPCALSARDI